MGRISVQFQVAIVALYCEFVIESIFGLFQQLTAFSVLAVTLVGFGLEIIAQFEIPNKIGTKNLKLNRKLIKLKICRTFFNTFHLVLIYLLSENVTHEVNRFGSVNFLIAVNRYIIDVIIVLSAGWSCYWAK